MSVYHLFNTGYSRAKLAVCKGTICPKNKKVAGEINLDLGENCTPVHVFYVPILSNLEGSRYVGERVQFYLAFTLQNGYEAYEVSHEMGHQVGWEVGKDAKYYEICHNVKSLMQTAIEQSDPTPSCHTLIQGK